MGRIQAMAVKEMNRELARGVRLSAMINTSEPVGLRVRSDAIVLRARASGSARLDLGPDLFAAKTPGH
jgi:hypothetical protein